MIQAIKKFNILFQDYELFKHYLYRGFIIYRERYKKEGTGFEDYVFVLTKIAREYINSYKPEFLYLQMPGTDCSKAIPQLFLIRSSLLSISKQVSRFMRCCEDEALLDLTFNEEDIDSVVLEEDFQEEVAKQEAEHRAKEYIKKKKEAFSFMCFVIFPFLKRLDYLLIQTRRDFEAGFGAMLEGSTDDVASGVTAASRLAYLFQLPDKQFMRLLELMQTADGGSASKRNPSISKSELSVAQTAILFHYMRRKCLVSGDINFSTLFSHVSQITGHSLNTLVQANSNESSLLSQRKKSMDAYDHEQVINYLEKVIASIRTEIKKTSS